MTHCSKSPTQLPTSPCIRECCLNEQSICMGCYRHVDEITAWSSADMELRERILQRCQQRRKRAMADRS